MKQFTSACLLIIATLLFSANAQEQQSVVVLKEMSNNPSIGIVHFKGDASLKPLLERTLLRCGWFKMAQNPASADIKMQVFASSPTSLQTQVIGGGVTFTTDRKAEKANLAVLETVDDILRNLFKIKAYCTQKIYYVASIGNERKEIYACYLDGSGQERITFNNAISTEPGFGHKNALVYTMTRNNSMSIVLADLANKRQTIISQAKGLNSSPGLNFNGSQLALPMSKDGRQVDLYVADLKNGGKTIRLTNDKNVESSPCWSPDGKQICYVSDKLGVPQIYLKTTVLQSKELRLSVGNNECVSPDWSNVSNKLCYSMKNNMGKRVIVVMDMADPSHPTTILTQAAGDWEAPSWAPDGRHIVCIRNLAAGSKDLYILDSWTREFQAISKGAKLSLPAWRPAY